MCAHINIIQLTLPLKVLILTRTHTNTWSKSHRLHVDLSLDPYQGHYQYLSLYFHNYNPFRHHSHRLDLFPHQYQFLIHRLGLRIDQNRQKIERDRHKVNGKFTFTLKNRIAVNIPSIPK